MAGEGQAWLHRLNNQLGVILAHAELIEAKAPDEACRTRAALIVQAALEAMALAKSLGGLPGGPAADSPAAGHPTTQ